MKRVQFSLITVLLVVTIVGLAMMVVLLWKKSSATQAEVRGLRDEVGRLVVDDPSRVHVARVRTPGEHTWKWRVWIPEGKSYALKFRMSQVPATGFPTNVTTFQLGQTGETWVEYRIEPHAPPADWADLLSTPIQSHSSSPEELNWMSKSRSTVDGEGVGYTTQSSEAGSRVLLYRHRVSEKATSSKLIEDPSEGFIIWLEANK